MRIRFQKTIGLTPYETMQSETVREIIIKEATMSPLELESGLSNA